MKIKSLGKFGVDSGQFMIVDPCYLDKWTDNEENLIYDYEKCQEGAVGEFSFNGACCTSLIGGGSLLNEIGARMAVVGRTGDGDGVYEVFAHIDKEGRTRKITVEFGEGE